MCEKERVDSVFAGALFDMLFLFVGAQDDSSDQALLIVFIVVGLIIAAAFVGLFYWLYIMKSRYTLTRIIIF